MPLTGHSLCQNVRHLAAGGQDSHAHVIHNENLKKHKINRSYKFGVTRIFLIKNRILAVTFHSPSFFTLLMTPLRISVKEKKKD